MYYFTTLLLNSRVLLMYYTVYWNGVGAAGLSCTELSIWEFLFLRGTCRQGGIVYDIVWMEIPRKDTLDNVAYTWCFISYWRLSPQLSVVSISVILHNLLNLGPISIIICVRLVRGGVGGGFCIFPFCLHCTNVHGYPLGMRQNTGIKFCVIGPINTQSSVEQNQLAKKCETVQTSLQWTKKTGI